jgi:hypothetical protein
MGVTVLRRGNRLRARRVLTAIEVCRERLRVSTDSSPSGARSWRQASHSALYRVRRSRDARSILHGETSHCVGSRRCRASSIVREENNHTRLYKRLDRQSVILERVEQHLGVLGESFAVFVQCWFAVRPKLAAGGEGEEARRSGKARAGQFFRHVAQQFGRGGRFLNELVREAVGSNAEPDTAPASAQNDQLAAIVESPEKPRG